MAKGWESKSVEEQQDLASQSPLTGEERERMSKERAEKTRSLHALNLNRARVLQQMDRCTNGRYRDLLQKELDHLDSEIQKLC
jgi:hypothetical protein